MVYSSGGWISHRLPKPVPIFSTRFGFFHGGCFGNINGPGIRRSSFRKLCCFQRSRQWNVGGSRERLEWTDTFSSVNPKRLDARGQRRRFHAEQFRCAASAEDFSTGLFEGSDDALAFLTLER